MLGVLLLLFFKFFVKEECGQREQHMKIVLLAGHGDTHLSSQLLRRWRQENHGLKLAPCKLSQTPT
jgi:hypothetical protein